jgi:hypothetical protein
MPWKKFTDEDEFYTFMGSAGSFIPVRLLPKSYRDAMREGRVASEQPQEQDPDEQAHEQRKDRK